MSPPPFREREREPHYDPDATHTTPSAPPPSSFYVFFVFFFFFFFFFFGPFALTLALVLVVRARRQESSLASTFGGRALLAPGAASLCSRGSAPSARHSPSVEPSLTGTTSVETAQSLKLGAVCGRPSSRGILLPGEHADWVRSSRPARRVAAHRDESTTRGRARCVGRSLAAAPSTQKITHSSLRSVSLRPNSGESSSVLCRQAMVPASGKRHTVLKATSRISMCRAERTPRLKLNKRPSGD